MKLVDVEWNRRFRKNLAMLIRQTGKTQKELCKEMKFNESLMSDMLNGRRLTIANVAHVASFFGVSIDWLVGNEPTGNVSYEEMVHELDLMRKIREMMRENNTGNR